MLLERKRERERERETERERERERGRQRERERMRGLGTLGTLYTAQCLAVAATFCDRSPWRGVGEGEAQGEGCG